MPHVRVNVYRRPSSPTVNVYVSNNYHHRRWAQLLIINYNVPDETTRFRELLDYLRLGHLPIAI